jgi:hypothetical protein
MKSVATINVTLKDFINIEYDNDTHFSRAVSCTSKAVIVPEEVRDHTKNGTIGIIENILRNYKYNIIDTTIHQSN